MFWNITYVPTYLHQNVCFRHCKDNPVVTLKPVDYLHYVDFTEVPKKNSGDDSTEEIDKQPKTNVENIVLDISDRILELPDA